MKKPELTCISEEGIADMDLPDNILDELDFLDNITSCNKVRLIMYLYSRVMYLSSEVMYLYSGVMYLYSRVMYLYSRVMYL